jgi:hypothetical protein
MRTFGIPGVAEERRPVTTRIVPAQVRVAWLLVCAGAVALQAGAERPVRRVIADLAGRPVIVVLAVGELRVQAWAEPGLDVEMVPEGRAAREPGTLDLTVEETPETVMVRAVQLNDGKDPSLKVRTTLRVPVSVTLQRVEVFEGRLDVEGVRGLLQAKVERGPIEARRIAGTVRLETGSGDLTVSDAELVSPGLLRLRTFNGHIRLGLVRRPTDARVLALTLNGSIRSDLPLEERKGFGPKFGEAVIGRGEPLISLDAVRGDLWLTVPPSR